MRGQSGRPEGLFVAAMTPRAFMLPTSHAIDGPCLRLQTGEVTAPVAIVSRRYRMPFGEDESYTAEDFIVELAVHHNGDIEVAGTRVLTDYRQGSLGNFCLELPS